jgi:hypothetical protein
MWRGAGGVGFQPATGARMYEQAAEASSRAGSARASYDDGDASGYESSSERESPLSSRDGSRIADLAARAARASRVWRSMNELQRRNKQLLLAPAATASTSGGKER